MHPPLSSIPYTACSALSATIPAIASAITQTASSEPTIASGILQTASCEPASASSTPASTIHTSLVINPTAAPATITLLLTPIPSSSSNSNNSALQEIHNATNLQQPWNHRGGLPSKNPLSALDQENAPKRQRISWFSSYNSHYQSYYGCSAKESQCNKHGPTSYFIFYPRLCAHLYYLLASRI